MVLWGYVRGEICQSSCGRHPCGRNYSGSWRKNHLGGENVQRIPGRLKSKCKGLWQREQCCFKELKLKDRSICGGCITPLPTPKDAHVLHPWNPWMCYTWQKGLSDVTVKGPEMERLSWAQRKTILVRGRQEGRSQRKAMWWWEQRLSDVAIN